MSIQGNCPECRCRFAVPDNLAGKKVRCPKCQAVFEARPGGDITHAPASGKAGVTLAARGRPDVKASAPPRKPASPWYWVGLTLAGVGTCLALLFLVGVIVWMSLPSRPASNQAQVTNPTPTPNP